MTTKEAVELMLVRLNTRKQFLGGTSGGWSGGAMGNVSMQQRDFNAALSLWHEKHQVSGLVQVAVSLHAYSSLTDDEYEQIMEALDGEK